MQTFKSGDKVRYKLKGSSWGEHPSWDTRVYIVDPCGKIARHEDGGFIYLKSNLSDIIKVENEMKAWGKMTDEEKGVLLLADHDGKQIEWLDSYTNTWEDKESTEFYSSLTYRVKPEPKVETVELFGFNSIFIWGEKKETVDTHKITFNTIDGEPDCNSIKMEKL